jgi:hypothetical protein
VAWYRFQVVLPADHPPALFAGGQLIGQFGRLFGFGRTQAINNQPAEGIAQVVQRFGQEDDISVISVTRTPVIEPALA